MHATLAWMPRKTTWRSVCLASWRGKARTTAACIANVVQRTDPRWRNDQPACIVHHTLENQ